MNNWFDREGGLARTVIYLAKLALFLAVPGVHLIVSGKKMLGYTVFVLMALAVIIGAMTSLNSSHQSFWAILVLAWVFVLLWSIAIIFLLAGLRRVGRTKIPPTWLLASLLILSTSYWPSNTEENQYDLYVETDYHMCPKIRYGDLVVFKIVRRADAGSPSFRINDIVIYDKDDDRIAALIQATPGQYVCTINGARVTLVTKIEALCPQFVQLGRKQYFSGGDLSENSDDVWEFEPGPISEDQIVGVQPVVVANWSAFYNATSQILLLFL